MKASGAPAAGGGGIIPTGTDTAGVVAIPVGIALIADLPHEDDFGHLTPVATVAPDRQCDGLRKGIQGPYVTKNAIQNALPDCPSNQVCSRPQHKIWRTHSRRGECTHRKEKGKRTNAMEDEQDEGIFNRLPLSLFQALRPQPSCSHPSFLHHDHRFLC